MLVSVVGAVPATGNPAGTQVVISQVYGGGGNGGSTLHERLHRALQPDSVSDQPDRLVRAVRRDGGSTWPRTNLGAVMLGAGKYYLVQEALEPAAPRRCQRLTRRGRSQWQLVREGRTGQQPDDDHHRHLLSVSGCPRPRRIRHRDELLRGSRPDAHTLRGELRPTWQRRLHRRRQQRHGLRSCTGEPAQHVVGGQGVQRPDVVDR